MCNILAFLFGLFTGNANNGGDTEIVPRSATDILTYYAWTDGNIIYHYQPVKVKPGAEYARSGSAQFDRYDFKGETLHNSDYGLCIIDDFEGPWKSVNPNENDDIYPLVGCTVTLDDTKGTLFFKKTTSGEIVKTLSSLPSETHPEDLKNFKAIWEDGVIVYYSKDEQDLIESPHEQPNNLSWMSLEGEWHLYNANEAGKDIYLNFNIEDNSITLSAIHSLRPTHDPYPLDYDPIVSYYGTFDPDIKPGGKIHCTLESTSSDGVYRFDGDLIFRRKDNFILVTLPESISAIGLKGETFQLFSTTEFYSAPLGPQPSVLQFFKAAEPYLYDSTVRDAARFIFDGKLRYREQEPTKVIDLANGYLSYTDGGPFSQNDRVEACIWRCANGNTLLGINCQSERFEKTGIYYTYRFLLFLYDREYQCLMRQDMASDQVFHLLPRDQLSQSLQLPRQGKDIKLLHLDENGKVDETILIPWKGNGFQ